MGWLGTWRRAGALVFLLRDFRLPLIVSRAIKGLMSWRALGGRIALHRYGGDSWGGLEG